MKDYYKILEVDRMASIEVIKAAYKALSKKYHPDKDRLRRDYLTRRMQEINEAYKVLSDEKSRIQYDMELIKSDTASKNTQNKGESEDYIHYKLGVEYMKEGHDIYYSSYHKTKIPIVKRRQIMIDMLKMAKKEFEIVVNNFPLGDWALDAMDKINKINNLIKIYSDTPNPSS